MNCVRSSTDPRTTRWAATAVRLLFAVILVATFVATLVACPARSPAVQRLYEGCEAGEARACFSLSIAYADGQLVERDLVEAGRANQRAVQLAEAGCMVQRQAEACHLLAARLYVGTTGGLSRDLPRAKQLFQHACDTGSARSCAMLHLIKTRGDAELLKESGSLFGGE